MKIRNISPLGDLDVTLLGREVGAGEVVDVTDAQAAELVGESAANFEYIKPAKSEKE